MPSKDTPVVKQELRTQMRSVLSSLSDEARELASMRICNKLINWLLQHPEITTVASFAPLATEPDLSQLLMSAPHIRWTFPHSTPDGQMTFHRVTGLNELTPGLYGILQPAPTSASLTPPDSIDCFLCPAFAYTREGARLGKGGGYYDRLLAQRSPSSHLIGVAFKEQLLECLPTEDHDINVDKVISD